MARTVGTIDLTPELSEKICNVLRAGNYIETAANYAGVTRNTFYRWLRRGARAEEADDTSNLEAPYRAFHAAVSESMAAAEIRDVALIAKAATDQWQAAAWRLERRYPEKWGRRERHEHTGKDGGAIEFSVKADDALFNKLTRLAGEPEEDRASALSGGETAGSVSLEVLGQTESDPPSG